MRSSKIIRNRKNDKVREKEERDRERDGRGELPIEALKKWE